MENKLRIRGINSMAVIQQSLKLTTTSGPGEWFGFDVSSTTGYVKIKLWNGEEEVRGEGVSWTYEEWSTIWYDKNIDSNELFNGDRIIEIKSCDINGNLTGDIIYINANNYFKSVNVSTLTNLKFLGCGGNEQLTSLNLNGLNSLEYLYIGGTSLTSLPNLPTTLKALDISELNLLPDFSQLTNLEELWSSNCGLTSLNFISSMPNLKYLGVDNNNNINSIDWSLVSNLKMLDISRTSISSINLSGNTSIEQLYASNCPLSEVDVTGTSNLKWLYLGDWSEISTFTSIDISDCINLIGLGLSGTQITSLDLLGLTDLRYLELDNTQQLTSLNVSNLTNLEGINLNYSGLTSFDFTQAPNLRYLDWNGGQFTSIDLSGSTNIEQASLMESSNLTSIVANNLSNLRYVYFQNTSVTSADFSGCTSLSRIETSTLIESLNLSGCSVIYDLRLNNTNISSLDISGCINLGYLQTQNSNLNELDHDAILIQLDSNGKTDGSFRSVLTGRTSASDVAYQNLLDKNWNIEVSVRKIYLTTGLNPGDTVNGSVRTDSGYLKVVYWDGTEEIFGNGNYWNWISFEKTIDLNDTSTNRTIELISVNGSGQPTGAPFGLQIQNCTEINISEIKYFDSLYLGNNPITTIDLSGVRIAGALELINTNMTSIDLSVMKSDGISTLWNSYKGIYEQVNIKGPYYLAINSNSQLTSINLSSITRPWQFSCGGNAILESLDASGMYIMEYLWSSYNGANSLSGKLNLNISNCSRLKYLSVPGSGLVDTDYDEILIDLDSTMVTGGSLSPAITRTAASDLAYSNLISRGWSISIGGGGKG